MNLDNYELTTIDYALRYYLEHNPNLDEEDVEWCTLVREKVDSIMRSELWIDHSCLTALPLLLWSFTLCLDNLLSVVNNSLI